MARGLIAWLCLGLAAPIDARAQENGSASDAFDWVALETQADAIAGMTSDSDESRAAWSALDREMRRGIESLGGEPASAGPASALNRSAYRLCATQGSAGVFDQRFEDWHGYLLKHAAPDPDVPWAYSVVRVTLPYYQHLSASHAHGRALAVYEDLEPYLRFDTEKWSKISAEVLAGMGELHSALGTGRAVEYFDRASASPHRSRKLDLAIELQRCMHQLELGRPDQAWDPFLEAKRIHDELVSAGSRMRQLTPLLGWCEAQLYFDLGQPALACQLAGELLASTPVESDLGLAVAARIGVLNALSSVIQPGGEEHLDEAISQLLEWRKRAADVPAYPYCIEARLAELEQRRGNAEAALNWIDSARELRDEGPAELGDELYLRGHGNLAAVACRALAASGLDPVRLEAEREHLERTFDSLVAAWSAAPPEASGRGLLAYLIPQRMLATLCSLEFGQEDDDRAATRALERVWQVHSASSLVRRMNLPERTLDELRSKVLSNSRGVWLFVPGPQDSYVFAFDRDRVSVARTAPLADLRDLAARLRAKLMLDPGTPGRRDSLDGLAEQLERALLPASIRARMETWDHLIIQGTQALADLHLECLPWSRRQSVGQRFATSQWFSLPLGLALSDAPLRETRGARLVASPTHPEGSGLAPLALDASRLLASAPGIQPAELLSGADATVDALLSSTEANPTQLLVLAHGLQDPSQPHPAGLQLAPSGATSGGLFSPDLVDWSSPPVVFLGACGVALGPSRLGDPGSSQLVGTFLARGARSVVASEVDLPVLPTLATLGDFQAAVFSGTSPAEALRIQRNRAIEAGDDPYLASSLRVFGAGHLQFPAEPERLPRRLERRLLPALAAVAMLMLGLWALRSRSKTPA